MAIFPAGLGEEEIGIARTPGREDANLGGKPRKPSLVAGEGRETWQCQNARSRQHGPTVLSRWTYAGNPQEQVSEANQAWQGRVERRGECAPRGRARA